MPHIVPVVFVSSTFRDLQPYRDTTAAVLDRYGLLVERMELVAGAARPEDRIKDLIRRCDLYVGILGYQYGSLVPGLAVSFTELEYQLSITEHLEHVLLIANDQTFVGNRSKFEQDDTARRQLQDLKSQWQTNHTPVGFSNTDFEERLDASINRWLEEVWPAREVELALASKPLSQDDKEWIAKLYSADPADVMRAIYRLTVNRHVLEHLYSLLRHKNEACYTAIFAVLQRADRNLDRVFDILLEMMRSGDATLRRHAVEAVGCQAQDRKPPAEILDQVLCLGNDTDRGVLKEVAHILRRLPRIDFQRQAAYLALLDRLAADPRYDEVRERAKESLSRLRPSLPPPSPARPQSSPPPQSPPTAETPATPPLTVPPISRTIAVHPVGSAPATIPPAAASSAEQTTK
jgi:hypothetical protein